MKVLLLGSDGQLGWELQRTCPENIELAAWSFPEVDLEDEQTLETCIVAAAPDLIINAAAYTNVDKAEEEKEKADCINHKAVVKIARTAKEKQIKLIHISTDFVFGGSRSTPHRPEDSPCPESVYGRTKLAGENAARKILDDNLLIIRTAWLYSSHRHNFVKTMLKLMKEKETLQVVDDQFGTPTWGKGLALAVWAAMEQGLSGIAHWTDAGVASWYDFAVAIQEEALEYGLLQRPIPIHPIPSLSYPTPAKRPAFSVLDKSEMWQALKVEPIHWRVQLRKMLKELG